LNAFLPATAIDAMARRASQLAPADCPVAERAQLIRRKAISMRATINSGTAIAAAIAFLQLAGTAFAADLGDCGHPVPARSIHGCSLLIEQGHEPPAQIAEFLLLRGTAFMINDASEQAIKDLDEAIRLNPNSAEAFYVRGDVYFKKGSYDRAMADYDGASWLDPDHIGAYLGRSDVHRKLGVERFGDHAFLAGKMNEAFGHINRRVMLLWHPHKYREWLERTILPLDEAIWLNPNVAEAYFKRASAFRELDDRQYDRALADYDQAIRLDPKHLEAYNGRGFLHRMKGQYDRAIADIDEVLRVQPWNATALSNRGIAYRMKHDYDRAIADFTEAIRLVPMDAGLYHSRGLAFEGKGERDKAIADYNKVLSLHRSPAASPAVDPSMQALQRLGAAVSASPRSDPAQKIARLDEVIKSSNPSERKAGIGRAYVSRCTAYIEMNEYDRAIADCDQALLLTPATAKHILAEAHHSRGIAYHRKLDLERATDDFDQAIRLHPSLAAPYYNRGKAHADKGSYGLAIDDYLQAIRLHPKIAEHYSSRGLAYERTGEREKAIAHYRKARQVHELNTKDPVFAPSVDGLRRLGAAAQ
jgi:tetratricopeptide (TPR) repeat protein